MPEPKSTPKTEDTKTEDTKTAPPVPPERFTATEAAKTAKVDDDFIFNGKPGGFYQILGVGFGGSGTVTVGGADAPVTAWGSERIEGQMPTSAKSGDDIVVHIGDHRTQRATYVG
jgi:hypothetical protein